MKISRFLLLALLFSVLVIAAHSLIYGSILTKLSIFSLSNSLFLIGVVIFFPSVALRIGSPNLFLGFRFTVYRFINAGKKKEYESLSDYIEANKMTPKGGMINEVMILSVMMLIAAYVLSLYWRP